MESLENMLYILVTRAGAFEREREKELLRASSSSEFKEREYTAAGVARGNCPPTCRARVGVGGSMPVRKCKKKMLFEFTVFLSREIIFIISAVCENDFKACRVRL